MDGINFRQGRMLLNPVDGIELRGGAVNVQMKNVRPVVVSSKIVSQLHLNSEVKITFGIENALFRSHRAGDDPAQGIDDQRTAAAIRIP